MRANGDSGQLDQRQVARALRSIDSATLHNAARGGNIHSLPLQRDDTRRVLLVASSGGHWIELCRLTSAFARWDCQFVSTAAGMMPPLGHRPVLQISDSSRDDLRTMFGSARQLRTIIQDFRPELIISTGAAPGALAILLGKLSGARTIWIDSIANSEELSLSGRAVRGVADLRLTQWPQLANQAKGITYFGQVM
ncbi:UDP-N-acetylglucosamine--LPS N-acetylglucosamine transferase [Sphingobium yanoikuyae]|uniref:UDP-N-acetylglucosamine--LPS N-acetylglucosamine transferase n=1 Tax=Sphingobium yanoikuyae TaxID=13690 RepID=A0A3G2URR5_SPHYA|nr:UDP-N-acetylglucosamine--LPS N-acetylglucosamine transferase [Sphingobium yanoikuyae]